MRAAFALVRYQVSTGSVVLAYANDAGYLERQRAAMEAAPGIVEPNDPPTYLIVGRGKPPG